MYSHNIAHEIDYNATHATLHSPRYLMHMIVVTKIYRLQPNSWRPKVAIIYFQRIYTSSSLGFKGLIQHEVYSFSFKLDFSLRSTASKYSFVVT